jgi:hypothetical protein
LPFYEVNLVLEGSHGSGDVEAFATLKLPLIPRVGQDIYFEAKASSAGDSGTYRVTAVGYHVQARKITGQTGDLFGISLTVVRI